jgi:branched-chain amino acid transport system permease protein
VTTFVTILVDAVSYGAWLFLTGVGLTLVFGVLRLLNVAHGGFYSVGAYMAAYAIGLAGANGLGAGWQFAAAGLAAIAVGAALGFVIERTVLGRLYGHSEAIVLVATYAVFLILEDATKLIWGGEPLYANAPRDALGQMRIGALQYPVYDIALVLVALALAAAVRFVLDSTGVGRCVSAVVADREMSAAMGIDVARIMTGTFVLGAALGALAGAMTAPRIAISPGIGVEVIVIAFAVIVIGGLGSIAGALVGALIVGVARALTAHLFPELELFAVYGVMAAVLAIRPYGLFARPEARRI